MSAGGGRAPSGSPAAAAAVDGGDLALGGGLLALVRPALDRLEEGGVLAVLADAAGVREDLPSWCRAEGHAYLGLGDGYAVLGGQPEADGWSGRARASP